MNAIAIIGCVVGIVTCTVGVATFISAQITKAKQDGMLVAKIDQCVNGIEDLKKDVKEKNKELDSIVDEHTRDIVKLKTQMRTVFEQLNIQHTKEG